MFPTNAVMEKTKFRAERNIAMPGCNVLGLFTIMSASSKLFPPFFFSLGHRSCGEKIPIDTFSLSLYHELTLTLINSHNYVYNVPASISLV